MFKEKEITQWIWDAIRTLWAIDESSPSNPDYALSIGLKYISKNSDRDCWISPKGCEDCSLASEGDAPLFARLLHKDYLRVKRTQKKGGE